MSSLRVGDQDSLLLEVAVLVKDPLFIVFFGNDHREVVFVLDHKPVGATHDVCGQEFLSRCGGQGTRYRDNGSC